MQYQIFYLIRYLKYNRITTLTIVHSDVYREMIDAILSNSRVHTLYLDSGDDIESKVQYGIFNVLGKLTRLSLYSYQIPGDIIPQFKMPSLILRRCKLGPEEAKVFRNMPWLKTLDLGYNPLGDEGAETLSSLPLEELRLVACNISFNGLEVFKNKTFTTLDLSQNPVGYEGLLTLLSFPNLINLELGSFIKIDRSQSTNYAINQNLKTLILRGNGLGTQEMMSLLTKFRNLKILDLSFTALTDENVLHLSNHPSITELNLCRCGLSPKGLGYLSTNPILETLDISHNSELQGDAVDKHFSNFPALTNLVLNYCPISDTAIANIAKSNRLQKLSLTSRIIVFSWGIIALALNANIRQLTFRCDKIANIYLRFFLGNQALDNLIIEDKPILSDFLSKRNRKIKKQQDEATKKMLLSCLPLPTALIPIVQDYKREYPYCYRLFDDKLEGARRQWAAVLPQIEKNLPEIKEFLKL